MHYIKGCPVSEKIDLYDNAKNIVQIAEYRAPVADGLNKLFVRIWFMNSDGLFLMQQRVSNTARHPNKWCATSGCVRHNENSLNTVVREAREELGIKVDSAQAVMVATIKHPDDFVDIWLVKTDTEHHDLILQVDEVQNAAWMSADEILAYCRAQKCTPSVPNELKIIQDFLNFKDGNY